MAPEEARHVKRRTSLEDAVSLISQVWEELDWLRNQIEAISGQIAGKANAVDTFTKDEINGLIAEKANAVDTFTKHEINGQMASKANAEDTFTKDEVNVLIVDKANAADTFTKDEINGKMASKANAADTFTKDVINRLIAGKTNAADTFTKDEINGLIAGKATDVGKDLQQTLDSEVGRKDFQQVERILGFRGTWTLSIHGTEYTHDAWATATVSGSRGDVFRITRLVHPATRRSASDEHGCVEQSQDGGASWAIAYYLSCGNNDWVIDSAVFVADPTTRFT